MSGSYYTHDEQAITRHLDVQVEASPEELCSSLEVLYEINETANEVIRGDFNRIALQFPDELLSYSVPIFQALKAKMPGRDLYVLADTSYGSCCVDEVAAQHIDADVVVHYGHACLSLTTRLPAIYVFAKYLIDVPHCIRSLLDESQLTVSLENSPILKTVIVMSDVAYLHQADSIFSSLRSALPRSVPLLSSIPPRESPSHRHNRIPPELRPEDCIIYYIGGESLGLTNILLSHAPCDIYSYDPKQRRSTFQSVRTNRLLMRRYAAMHKARDADVFGILVGTLGVASYLPLISQLRKAIARKHKKSYTLSVGKLNPSKLANFMEIECFVLVACPENTVIDAKEFLRPIITPFELGLALLEDIAWPSHYLLDLDEVLSEQFGRSDGPDDHDNNAVRSIDGPPTFSLVTGAYRHPRRFGELLVSSDQILGAGMSGTLAVRNNEGAVSKVLESAAGQFLQGRTYRGLEQNLGEHPPSILEQGRSGIAKGYGELVNKSGTDGANI
ncbi:hypothetical protein BS47DRAFT_1288643 [Hydnum rufescens UP504]|uniref:2-(3-amino-3-carboxypropyl)histidine synthase subunit 2 n=1 Tax=Hydnum rufescens UP504 TaxID=1448309 RepID=A0A9P6E1B3_9AGAM|nr:hypothetical protein BS47DRAFT_1288643 [Hydnum rufescens UP504]